MSQPLMQHCVSNRLCFRYSETLLRKDSTGHVTTNTTLQKEHGHSHSNKPKVDRGRRPLIIATALCGVFFIAGRLFLFLLINFNTKITCCRAGRRFILGLVGNFNRCRSSVDRYVEFYYFTGCNSLVREARYVAFNK